MEWKQIDSQIYALLSKFCKLRFSEMLGKVDTNPETLSVHLKKMTDQKILERDPYTKPGKKGYYWLSYKTKFEMDLNIFKGVKGVKQKRVSKEERDKDRERKLILFLLLATSHDYITYKKSSKTLAGDLLIPGSNGRPVSVSGHIELGFSPKDLDADRDSQYLSLTNSLLSLNRFGRKQAEQIINELEKKDNYVKLRKILSSDGKEIRFTVSDDTLKDFLSACATIVKLMVYITLEEWFVLSRKPKEDEYSWFSFVMGDENTANFLSSIRENKRLKKTIRNIFIEFFPYYKILNRDQLDNLLESMKSFQYQKDKKLEGDELIKYRKAIKKNKKKLPDSYLKKVIEDNIRTYKQFVKMEFSPMDDKKEYYQKRIKERYPWIFDNIKDIVRPQFAKSLYKSDLFDEE